MIFKLMIPLFLATQGTLCDDSLINTLIDGLGAQVFPIGAPLEEDMAVLLNACNKMSATFFADNKEKIKSAFKGTSLIVLESVVSKLSPKDTMSCKLVINGESEKALKMIKEFNKYVDHAQTLQTQLITALSDAAKPDSKVTYPILICYFKEFKEKYLSIYPDVDGAKDMAKSSMEYMIIPSIDILESTKGKAADKCELPAPPSVEPEYKSIFVPFLKAMDNFDK